MFAKTIILSKYFNYLNIVVFRDNVCALLLYSNGFAGDISDSKVSEAELEAAVILGRASAAAMLQGSVVLFAPDLQQEIQNLAVEISNAACSHVRPIVHIINEPSINLFTLPSGIFVFTGFIDKIENRDELAFGIAHEIAHSCLGHGLSKMKYNLNEEQRATSSRDSFCAVATTASTLAANFLPAANIGVWEPLYDKLVRGYVGTVVSRLAGKVTINAVFENLLVALGTYSQAQETEADQYAMIYMKKAGYNPSAAITAMEKFSDVIH